MSTRNVQMWTFEHPRSQILCLRLRLCPHLHIYVNTFKKGPHGRYFGGASTSASTLLAKCIMKKKARRLVCYCTNYCNSVLYGLPTSLIRRLQSVQNATARLLFGIRRSEHISPALISLHWLRIPERISELTVLTYRATHGAGPSYLQTCFTRVADMPSRRRLRSSGSDQLHVPIICWSTSRQSHFHSFWRCGMKRPAGSRHSCAITRGLQTASQDISVFTIIPWHCDLTHKLHVLAFCTCVDPTITSLFRPREKFWWWWWWCKAPTYDSATGFLQLSV